VNAHSLAQSAYRGHGAPTRTARDTEFDIIAEVTRRLKTAADNSARDFATLATAVHQNRRLWTLLAADAADPGNTLPDEIRARVVYLAEFTTLHSSKVLRNEASATPLVDINTAVLRGLRAGGGAQS
jgi:flagellar protein FlaF